MKRIVLLIHCIATINFLYAQSGAEPEMILVQGGAFEMGVDTGRYDQGPAHKVQVSTFKMSKYEITVAEFRYFIMASRYKTTADTGGGSMVWEGDSFKLKPNVNWKCSASGALLTPDMDYFPVTHISWNDAVAYCRWLTSKTGKTYRLPTEAEWEFAARGGVKNHGYTYSGGNNAEEVAWHNKNSVGKVHRVGLRKANELGLCDMSGNLWEWCADWYSEDYYRKTTYVDPQGIESGQNKTLRGGGWYNDHTNCTVYYRNYAAPDSRYDSFGFRVVTSQ